MIDAGRALELAVQVTILVGAAYAGFRWFRGLVRREVGAVREQVEPNGGRDKRTSRALLEQTAGDVAELGARLNTLAGTAEQNRELGTKAVDIATKALAVAENTAQRLDGHLERGHAHD